MRSGKGLPAEQSITQSLWLPLDYIENLCRVAALGEVAHDVSLFCRDYHADLFCPGSNHALDEVLCDCLWTLNTFHHARSYGQELFGTAEWLDALAGAGRGYDSDHATSPFAVD